MGIAGKNMLHRHNVGRRLNNQSQGEKFNETECILEMYRYSVELNCSGLIIRKLSSTCSHSITVWQIFWIRCFLFKYIIIYVWSTV